MTPRPILDWEMRLFMVAGLLGVAMTVAGAVVFLLTIFHAIRAAVS